MIKKETKIISCGQCDQESVGYSHYIDLDLVHKKDVCLRIYSTFDFSVDGCHHPPRCQNVPKNCILLLHGAGLTSLSFSLMIRYAKRSMAMAAGGTGGAGGSMADESSSMQFIGIDVRGHGHSSNGPLINPESVGVHVDGDQSVNVVDLRIDTMIDDILDVVNSLFRIDSGAGASSSAASSSPPPRTSLLIAGHSMGGAIAVKLCSKEHVEMLKMQTTVDVVGLCVLDVVEGTAMESLEHAKSSFEERPQSFNSLEEAVNWSVESGLLRNIESAQVSIPDQLIKVTTAAQTDSAAAASEAYKWRTDVSASSIFWKDWFTGLSNEFLQCPLRAKFLILAGTDRLDGPLMAAQMGGKFQLLVAPDVRIGHFVQEDAPSMVANALLVFQPRGVAMSRTVMKIVPKSGAAESSNKANGVKT